MFTIVDTPNRVLILQVGFQINSLKLSVQQMLYSIPSLNIKS